MSGLRISGRPALVVSKLDKTLLTCPHCGHQQLESRTAFSAACKQCNGYLRVQDLLKPAVAKAAAVARPQRRITCFDCGTEFDVPTGAQSTMCKRCSRYIDLHDYSINNAVSRNFRTKGSFVIQTGGNVFNSETLAAEAVIKGRFLGKLTVERSLTLYSTAQIKGAFTAAQLIVPADNQLRWPTPIKVAAVEIHGELIAELHADAVCVKSNGRLSGTLTAKSVIAEDGAVLEVDARIGGAKPEPVPPAPATAISAGPAPLPAAIKANELPVPQPTEESPP